MKKITELFLYWSALMSEIRHKRSGCNIVVGNGYGNPSSNSAWGWLHF